MYYWKKCFLIQMTGGGCSILQLIQHECLTWIKALTKKERKFILRNNYIQKLHFTPNTLYYFPYTNHIIKEPICEQLHYTFASCFKFVSYFESYFSEPIILHSISWKNNLNILLKITALLSYLYVFIARSHDRFSFTWKSIWGCQRQACSYIYTSATFCLLKWKMN